MWFDDPCFMHIIFEKVWLLMKEAGEQNHILLSTLLSTCGMINITYGIWWKLIEKNIVAKTIYGEL